MTYFDDTNELTMALDEVLSAADGNLVTGDVVLARLLANIHAATHTPEHGDIPVLDVAQLLLGMYHHMHGDQVCLLMMMGGQELPENLDDLSDLRRAIHLKTKLIAARVLLAAPAKGPFLHRPARDRRSVGKPRFLLSPRDRRSRRLPSRSPTRQGKARSSGG